MEMRRYVVEEVHANDDSEEAGNLRHQDGGGCCVGLTLHRVSCAPVKALHFRSVLTCQGAARQLYLRDSFTRSLCHMRRRRRVGGVIKHGFPSVARLVQSHLAYVLAKSDQKRSSFSGPGLQSARLHAT